jgi:putative phosphonate metabolism protein
LPRYAIYFVPSAETEFFRFGSAVLGYDCYTGGSIKRPAIFDAEPELWDGLAAEPRRYGFHATLKAPFNLSPSCREAQIVSALHSFAGLGHTISALTPAVRMLGGFAAIVPAAASPALDELAAKCTTIFDAFRAPMTAQERARRVASGLNQGQVANLDRWGYPYVFSDFRFHMTLTGRIDAERSDDVLAMLQKAFSRACKDRALAIERISLVRQNDENSPFRVIEQATLRAAR